MVEVHGLELHGLRELSGVALAEVLLDVHLHVRSVLLLVEGLVGRVPFPSALLFLLELLLLVLGVLAVEAAAELAALDALLEAEAVLLLAVRLLADAEEHVAHAGVVGVHLLEVVQVLAVLLFEQLGQLALLLPQLQLGAVLLQLVPPRLLQELVLGRQAAVAALPDHADLPRGQEAAAVLPHALLLSALALVRNLELRLPVQVLLLDVGLIYIANSVQE